MVGRNNSTTMLLFVIVLILLMGLGVAIYYVLELDWFSKKPVEVKPYSEQQNIEAKIEKEIKYDIKKRTYNIVLNTADFEVVVYKDGRVGITMIANDKYKNILNYNELLEKEMKLELKNIIRAYEVEVGHENSSSTHIVLLDSEGNLYNLAESELITNGKYVFNKIEGLAKIIDVRQITNDGILENVSGINAIAIDEESNELLLTDYLFNRKNRPHIQNCKKIG